LWSVPLGPGGHSAFPAHEFYIQAGTAPVDAVIQYDPIPNGGTVFWLCDPLITSVRYNPGSGNKTGSIATSSGPMP